MTTSSLGERMARLEGAYEQINERLGRMESVQQEMRSDMRSQFFWLLGLLIPMWVTIVLTVVLRS